MISKKIPFYFSIDFEDFYHDSLRALNIKDPESKPIAMRESYLKIKEISRKHFNNKKITFFVTGVLAEKMPDLIREINEDGHEIGCHYNFHDNINRSNRQEFAFNLDEAIKKIYTAINKKPIGFRAPNFAIDSHNYWAYEELSKRFMYDSSYKTSEHINKLKNQEDFLHDNNHLKEFFIFGMPTIIKNFSIRSGGTFLRLFSANTILKSMKKSHELGHVPLIYMHPYELTLNHEFWMKWRDLKSLPYKRRIYIWLRQIQWSHIGHNSVDKKIEHICKYFEHQGPMKYLVQ